MLSLMALAQPGNGSPPVVGFPEVERLLSLRNDTVYVLNFWATWCVPCVKELPAFRQLHAFIPFSRVCGYKPVHRFAASGGTCRPAVSTAQAKRCFDRLAV